MSKDRRLFARFDLDYADHPKIVALSDEAFRAHVEMILYARKYMTDGVINKRVANRLASQWDTDVLTELQSNDEAAPSLIALDNGGYYLHGFEDMQETRTEIEARTARNRANGLKGGRPPKKKKTQSDTGPQTQPGAQKKAETETEIETEVTTTTSAPTHVADAAKPNHHQTITRNIYDRVGGAINFAAVMGIVKWATTNRPETPQRIEDACVNIYDLGKPITKQTLGQMLDGKFNRHQPSQRPNRVQQNMDVTRQLWEAEQTTNQPPKELGA